MEIKIALAQIEIIPGQPQKNLAHMLSYVEKAKKQKVAIIVFPELAIPGCLLGNLWEYEYFLRECEQCGRQLIEQSTGIVIVFGNIAIDWSKKDENGQPRKYNACFVAQEKQLKQGALPYPFYIKTLLSDHRHFFNNIALACELQTSPENLIEPFAVKINNEEIFLGCVICEDGLSFSHTIDLLSVLKQKSADIFINISSSSYYFGKTKLIHNTFSHLAKKENIPLVYVNNTGVQNNGKNIYSFDGASCLYDCSGQLLANCSVFTEELMLFSFDKTTKTITVASRNEEKKHVDEQIYVALEYSLRKFLQQSRIQKMTIGISGGIDSAVSAALFTHILGNKNVLLINMPSVYNSSTTIELAQKLAHNLGTHYAVIPVVESVELTKRQIPIIEINGQKLNLNSFALENVQARDRSSRILAAASSAFGSSFSCNANKSEITIGYGTFYGDLAGAIAPLADLWKYQVYGLGKYLNEKVFASQVIPDDVFEIMPSAELSAAQTVGTGGDPLCYPYHDYLFKAFIEGKLSPVELLRFYQEGTLEKNIGCQKGLVKEFFTSDADFFEDLEKWWLLLHGLAVAKRIQSPPIVTLSARAFGTEYRESQLPAVLPTEYMQLKKQILSI